MSGAFDVPEGSYPTAAKRGVVFGWAAGTQAESSSVGISPVITARRPRPGRQANPALHRAPPDGNQWGRRLPNKEVKLMTLRDLKIIAAWLTIGILAVQFVVVLDNLASRRS